MFNFKPTRFVLPSSNPTYSRGFSISRMARSNPPKKDGRGLPITPHHKEPSPVATDMDLKVPKMFRSFAGLSEEDDQQMVQPGHKQPVYTTTSHGPQYVDEAEQLSKQRAEKIALSDPPKSTVDKYPKSHKISHNEVDDAKNLQSHNLPRDVHPPSMPFREVPTSRSAEDDHNLEGRNMGNVLGGYKATLSNPNSSEEAKEHARQVLEQYGALHSDHPTSGTHHYANNSSYAGMANSGNVMGGYKATISNPNTSQEAKQYAQEALHGMNPRDQSLRSAVYNNPTGDAYGNTGHHADTPYLSQDTKQFAQQVLNSVGIDIHGSQANRHHNSLHGNVNNVMGGFKATISNPDTSQEAKQHAQEVLNRNGVDRTASSVHYEDAVQANPNNVLGGYKATISNANTSHEAKQHAQEMVNRNRVDVRADSEHFSNPNPNNVMGGYKATMSNPNTSNEAKRYAEQVVRQTGVDPRVNPMHSANATNQNGMPNPHATTGHIMGGYKATMNNPKTSPEAKDHAAQMLGQMEADGAIQVESMSSKNSQHTTEELRAPRSKVATDMDLKVPNILKKFAGMGENEVPNQDQGDVYSMEYKSTPNGPQYVHKDAPQRSNVARAVEEDQSEMLMEEDVHQGQGNNNRKGRPMRK